MIPFLWHSHSYAPGEWQAPKATICSNWLQAALLWQIHVNQSDPDIILKSH
jgi:hypothetical protein